MVFSSHIFLFYFLPLALAAYYLVPRSWRNPVLTLFSYGFYGWANPLFVPLMLFSTTVDYICGLILARPVASTVQNKLDPIELAHFPVLPRGEPRSFTQKCTLVLSIAANLTTLGFFKYFNFGLDSFNALASTLGFSGLDWTLRVTLPLGISFYTFQSMSYAIDVYRGDARAIRRFGEFACYVAMFPQLVAGPIIRFQDVADQLARRTHTKEKFARGVAFFSFGLAKKILLANPCGKIADTVFGTGSVYTLDAWYGMFSYAFQIYFDFSGYSDMAIGLGLMLGFVFVKNFDSPYISQSITEFWRRWHLSLSTWLRDNLYFPLGGSRKGEFRTYCNLSIVMLLGGLWHGASWNFAIWGGIHGGMLAFERWRGKHSLYERLPSAGRIACTFVLTSLAWVFFRADNLPSALTYCRALFHVVTPCDGASLLAGLIYRPYYLLSFLTAGSVAFLGTQTWDFTRTLDWRKAFLCGILLIISIVMMEGQAFNPFIYFIF